MICARWPTHFSTTLNSRLSTQWHFGAIFCFRRSLESDHEYLVLVGEGVSVAVYRKLAETDRNPPRISDDLECMRWGHRGL